MRRADHPAVGLVLDSFHTLARKTDLKAIRSIPRDRIFLVQVADAPVLDMDPLSWSRHFRNFPGQGDLAAARFHGGAAGHGFDGLLSLEIFNDQFRAGSRAQRRHRWPPLAPLPLDQLRSRTGVTYKALPALPTRSKCLGTEFIEFAIDEDSEPPLRGSAAQPGLRQGRRAQVESGDAMVAGRHQPRHQHREGRLRAFLQHHARHVGVRHRPHGRRCRARRSIARSSLLDQPFRQAVGPGELEIPAVRGVGGSLLYFIDPKSDLARVWDVEFEPTGEDAKRQGAGLTTVDHISQSMHYEEMLTWLLFYTSLLDVSKTPEQDVLDPGGLVKSQVVQAADGALRLVLNASQSKHAMSSRFLSEAFGSGVQHIAFATDDIFATVKRLKANGVAASADARELLRRPREPRPTSPPSRSTRSGSTTCSMTATASGEYLQVYTQTFEDRFFFEIVERRGYKGFGAANASIRLAAQSRLASSSTL